VAPRDPEAGCGSDNPSGLIVRSSYGGGGVLFSRGLAGIAAAPPPSTLLHNWPERVKAG
jgi:hypothetical protein